MYKYNLYDNGEIVLKNVRPNVINKMLGITHSRISNLIDTGTLYKKRYRIERVDDDNLAYIKDSMEQKRKMFGEDTLKEWDEVTQKFRNLKMN